MAGTKTAVSTPAWLTDLARLLGSTDPDVPDVVLRVVLHALRDRLGPEEVALLGGHLPFLVRVLYYDGWTTTRRSRRFRQRDAFLHDIAQGLAVLRDPPPAGQAAQCVFRLLRQRVPVPVLQQVLSALPRDLRMLLDTGSAGRD